MATSGSAGEQPVITTDRLVLRPFALADAEAVQRLAGDWAIADTTQHVPHPYPDGAAEQWIASLGAGWRSGAAATFAVADCAEGSLLGATGLTVLTAHARGELGYWIAVRHWNQGYASEAGRAMLRLGFLTLGLHRVQATHLTRNPASGRVMQKLGMRFEGIQREAIRKWDRFEDLALYAILASDWKAIEENATVLAVGKGTGEEDD